MEIGKSESLSDWGTLAEPHIGGRGMCTAEGLKLKVREPLAFPLPCFSSSHPTCLFLETCGKEPSSAACQG